jgi:two-component system, LytTR family, response regulator
MINIAVCDDEILELKKTTSLLKEYSQEHKNIQFNVETFQKPLELIDYINKKGGFDVYILDILMDGVKGTDVAAEIRSKKNNSEIIFVTNSKEYAVDAFALNAAHYLTKPCSKEKFDEALNRVVEKIEERGKEFIVRNTSDGLMKINLNEFVYSESSGHYQYVHLTSGVCLKIRSKTSELWEDLKSYKRFLQPHSGYIVNMDYVKNITSFGVSMEKIDIPISKNTYNSIKKIYLDYTFNKG